MSGEERKHFISYDYKEIIADYEKASFLLDAYVNFGWQPDENQKSIMKNDYSPYQKKMVLYLKRDRKIMNKMELTRLQRNFEACMKEIETLEKSRNSKAVMWALIVGILGTAFMAGSVFSIVMQPPQILLCIILAVPAFIGWIVPYFLYRKISVKESEKLEVLVEEKYDEIDRICEKGNKLLY